MKKSIFLSAFALTVGLVAMTGCGGSTDPNQPKTREERVADIESQIRASEEWLQKVKQKAEDNHVPLDTMIFKDASWMVDDQDGKHKPENAPAADAPKPADAPKTEGEMPKTTAPADAPKPAGH